MKKLLCAFFALILLISASACAQAGENLILNGDFSQLDAAGMPVHWEKGMWFTDAGVSSFSVSADGCDGNCASIINFSDNDARFSQTISVEPDSYYRFSCLAMAEGCGEEGYGATISIEDTFSYSNEILDSNGQWEELVLYGKTGPEQTQLTVMLRIGGYSMINSGSARFDNVEAVKLDSLPSGVEAQLLYRETASSAGQTSADTETVPARNTETWLLMAALYAVLILALVRRSHRLHSLQSGRNLLWIGLGIALVLRLIIAFLVRGYNTDINCFSAWSERIFAKGPANFYSPDYFCDYPPGYMLMLWPIAAIRNLLGLPLQSGLHIVLLKLIPILCDLLGAMLIWRCAEKKRLNTGIAAGLALLYAFNPAAIIDSAAWGQIDSVFTLLIALCALKAAEEKYIPSLAAFALAMLIKPQALLFAPLGLFAIIVNLIRRKSAKATLEALLGVLAALGVIYAAAFVFCIGSAQSIADAFIRPVSWVFELYGGTMSGYKYITVNALNLYTLFDMNWTTTANAPVWTIVAWILFALSYLYTAFLYVKSGSHRRLALTGALLITLIFTFGPMIHERYIFPALILLTLAYACDRDRRLLVSLTIMTVTAALNEILVLQGGMTEANYGHLQSSEQWLNALLSLINVANALYLSWIALDICAFSHVYPLKKAAVSAVIPESEKDHHLHLRGQDYLLMIAVTLVYSAVAFTNLGTTAAPQTSWVSTQSGESIVFDLGEKQEFTMIYYGGICNSTFTVELSDDGEFWTEPDEAKYDQGEIFRWIFHCDDGSDDPMVMDARYLRITANSAGLKLSEFGFRNAASGELISAEIALHGGYMAGFESSPEALIDEQYTVVEKPSYYNSTYFDEIYHARTAYELLHGEYAYEWTHPHLGKILMMVGIQLFGMCPFGWRFMGALIGVLMVPLMYLLAKQLTKSSKLSFVAMCLMALDSMHFTQTRIATIDSYAVFWIMLMYLFMFRYAQMDWKKVSLGRSLVPLGLCGITMGIAWATKWIGIYGSAGLAIIFFWKLIAELMHAGEQKKTFLRRILISLAFCLLFYIVIPVLIYYFSYYPQLRYEGVATFKDMFSARWVKRIVELQESILGYHAGLGGDTHYFRSPWYQWPIVWWPMWYYSGAAHMSEDMVSSISCMGNPAVWWSGLIALIAVLILCAWKRRAPRNWLLVLVGFASQFLPWVLVPRSTFIYHYFASVPFIILCTALVLGWLAKKNTPAAKYTAIGLVCAALILFAAFYPLESGLPVAKSYAKYLRWFKWYNY